MQLGRHPAWDGRRQAGDCCMLLAHGCAQVFMRARKYPELGWQAYVASAHMEWQHDRKDQIPRNILELGLKAFLGVPEYVEHYVAFLLGEHPPQLHAVKSPGPWLSRPCPPPASPPALAPGGRAAELSTGQGRPSVQPLGRQRSINLMSRVDVGCKSGAGAVLPELKWGGGNPRGVVLVFVCMVQQQPVQSQPSCCPQILAAPG
jgi:hypothetical protein